MAVFKDTFTGTWCAKFRYPDFNGKLCQKKRTGFATKKEAQQFETEFLDKLKQSSDILFKSLCEKYLADIKTYVKPSSYYSINNLIKDRIINYFGAMRTCDIEPLHVRKWYIAQQEKGYSDKYLKDMKSQLSSIFKFGMEYYKISVNPVISKRKKKSSNNKPNVNFWTLDEFNQFMTIFNEETPSLDSIQYGALFTLLFYSGMRIGEALALNYADFDFENNTVTISKTYVKLNKQEWIQTPKTRKGNRTITLPVFVMNRIMKYRKYMFGMNDEQDRLFPISRNTLNHRFDRWCKLSGVKRIRIHDIRHSHASLLIEKGVEPLAISERLGHENIQTTLGIYSHLYPNKQGQIANMLEMCSTY